MEPSCLGWLEIVSNSHKYSGMVIDVQSLSGVIQLVNDSQRYSEIVIDSQRLYEIVRDDSQRLYVLVIVIVMHGQLWSGIVINDHQC